MTVLDTYFDDICTEVGFSWAYVLDGAADRSLKLDRAVKKYPCILRTFNEPLLPLFDPQQRVRRRMSLYVVNLGFTKATTEQIAEYIERTMFMFVEFRDKMRRHGFDIQIQGDPFPQWQQTNMDEFGIVIDATVTYTLCLKT